MLSVQISHYDCYGIFHNNQIIVHLLYIFNTLFYEVDLFLGKGSVFSGYEIVKWLVKNIAGVTSEEDAERIGQIMLDKGAIFHSEGSR